MNEKNISICIHTYIFVVHPCWPIPVHSKSIIAHDKKNARALTLLAIRICFYIHAQHIRLVASLFFGLKCAMPLYVCIIFFYYFAIKTKNNSRRVATIHTWIFIFDLIIGHWGDGRKNIFTVYIAGTRTRIKRAHRI